MKRACARSAIIVFWLCMLAWLIRCEAFPEYFTRSLDGYAGILSRDVLVKDSWMKVIFGDKDIGYSYTSVNIDESIPANRYKVDNQAHLRLKIVGVSQDIFVNTSVSLDAAFALQKFSFSVSSRGPLLSASGTRAAENKFEVEMAVGNITNSVMLDIPRDVVVFSPTTAIALGRLRPGRELAVRTLDPTSLKTVNVLARSLRKESIAIGGVEHEATVLALEYRGMKIITWVDPDGEVLRQETPIGVTLEKCSQSEALAAVNGADADTDILKEAALRMFSW